ncbi:hypothetical protein Agub_g11796, partial [Astrephomene gubernaculifera]
MDYNGKLVLAPMVRVGTHPMRLLAAGYGADIVYGEELVDKRVIASVRRVNAALGTVDFLDKGGEQGGRVMFRTSPSEAPRLVFQLGTSDPAAALAAAQVVCGDVACVDVNMGCPKQFSLQGGMGAALLRKPELAEDILKTLRRNLNLPVSCKIRVLDDPRDTVELARRLASCGICALAVHGRTSQQRPRDPADWGHIRTVVGALPDLPVIANGDVMSYEDAVRVRQETGAAAAMIARAAMWNASVFRPQGFLPLDVVQRQYVRLAVSWDNALPNTKNCLKEMADAPASFPGRAGGPRVLQGHEGNVAVTRVKDNTGLLGLLGLGGQPPYQEPQDASTAAVGAGCGPLHRDTAKQPASKRPQQRRQQQQREEQQQDRRQPGLQQTTGQPPQQQPQHEAHGGRQQQEQQQQQGGQQEVAATEVEAGGELGQLAEQVQPLPQPGGLDAAVGLVAVVKSASCGGPGAAANTRVAG